MFRLVSEGDSSTMMDISVTTKPIVLGRGEGSTHLLKDSSVSLNHAKIIMRKGKVYIRDLESTNGVFVNGEKISIEKGRVISPGDEIKIGMYRFSLEEYNQDKDIDNTMFMPGIIEAARFTLLRKGDSGKEMEFSVTNRPITIGRGEGNTIVLGDPGVSLNHAKILMRQNNVYVRDLESTNGVFVNGLKISTKRGQIVYPGDEIKIGTCLFVLELHGEDEGAENTMLIAPEPADRNEEELTETNVLHMEKETDRRKNTIAKTDAESDDSEEISERENGTLMKGMDTSAVQVSKLVISSGDDTGKGFLLKDELFIGRSEDNDIILKDPKVSRGHHAKAVRHKDDSFTITDLNSTNGVFVNGKKIETNKDQVISPGDEIKIGTSLLALELHSEDEGADNTMLNVPEPADRNKDDLKEENVVPMDRESDSRKDVRAKSSAEAAESKEVSEREGGTLMMGMDKSALQVSS